MTSPAPFFGESNMFRGRGSYANPHATIAQRDIPVNLRQVLRLCRWYFQTDSILGAIVDKMAEYPITDVVVRARPGVPLSPKQKERWEYLLNVVMNVRQAMKDINVDKFVYGNSMHMLYLPFVRVAKCATCGKQQPLSSLPYYSVRENVTNTGRRAGASDTEYDFTVNAHCTACGGLKDFSVHDRPSQASQDLKMVRLSPLQFELEYNPASGRQDWYWSVPDIIKNGMNRGVRCIAETTDLTILKASQLGQRLLMNPDRLWVAQADKLPGLFEGWGIPPMFRTLEDVYHYKILRRANEQLAQEHVVPLRIITPAMVGDASAQRTVNLGDWQQRLRFELQRWKSDNNHMLLSPVPLNIEQLGGNARVMMVAAEIEAAARIVATGLGCPIEFIWGGLNWTGASVSLRVLENHFMVERAAATRLLHFLMPRLARHFKLPVVDLSLSDFKMADDVQKMSNDINMMLQGYLSRGTVLADQGRDPDKEMTNLEAEHARLNKITMKDQVDAAHMQMLIRKMEALGEILMQFELKLEQQRLEARAERQRLRDLQAFAYEVQQRGLVTPIEFDQSSMLLSRMQPDLQQLILSNWAQTMPTVTQALMLKIQYDQGATAAASAALQSAPGAQNFGQAESSNLETAQGPYSGGAEGAGGADMAQPTDTNMDPMPEQRAPRRDGAM